MTPRIYEHRALLGWISEFVNRPLPGVWPQIPLDDKTLTDLDDYAELAQESGYNELMLFGLFVDRRWPVDIASCVDSDRRKRIAHVLDSAHRRGLKVLSGLGLYSWGFDAIIEAFPELSRTNARALCPSVPASQEWMRRVIDFILGEFDVDGLNMQSADQGRCECDACRRVPSGEYHARLNREIAQYIRARWHGKILVMDNWGNPLTDPTSLPTLAEASQELDAIIDTDNSAEKAGRAYRKTVIESLDCPFGTLAGCSIWPPQNWARDKWFIPTTLVNADYLRDLRDDGGRAAETFVTTLANPSGEISLRFMGRLLDNPDANPDALLRSVVERMYAPRNLATLDSLAEIVLEAERAYFTLVNPEGARQAYLLMINAGLSHEETPQAETYLYNLSPENRAAYGEKMAGLAVRLERIRPFVGATKKAELSIRCLQTVAKTAQRIQNEIV